MTPLSQQLSDLSTRVKHTEDVVTAAHESDRRKLQDLHGRLSASVDASSDRMGARVDAVQGAARSDWDAARSSVSQWFAGRRASADERKAERTVHKAERRADAAEQDAVDAVDLAEYVLDQAELAIVDAALARAESTRQASRDTDV